MTSKKAASLSSTLLARKGSAVPAGLSEAPSTTGTPLPGLLNTDTDKKNGNGHFHPISLEPPRKSSQTAKLGCDDPLQPPLIPGLTTQTGPTFKTDAARKSETPQDAKERIEPAAATPPSPKRDPKPPADKPVVGKPAKAETTIKAAPPLRPKAPAPSTPRLEQDYPQPPEPRATPTKTHQPLVAERRTKPETAPSAARLAAAAAGKTGEPMPMPALAAIATVVALALAGAAYLFFSDKDTATTVAEPPAEETTTVAAAAVPTTAEIPAADPAAAPASTDKTAVSVSAGDSEPAALPTPRPATTTEPVTHLAATQPLADAAESESSGDTAIAETATAAIATAQPVAADTAADDGPEPAPPRPAADTSNIVPTAASAAPVPARKPERLAALSGTAGGDDGGRFAVQLASVPSAAAAEREIRRLRRAYPTLFGAMPIDVQRSRGSYRLMSQRFENRGEAADLCQSLKDAGRGCLVLAR